MVGTETDPFDIPRSSCAKFWQFSEKLAHVSLIQHIHVIIDEMIVMILVMMMDTPCHPRKTQPGTTAND